MRLGDGGLRLTRVRDVDGVGGWKVDGDDGGG